MKKIIYLVTTLIFSFSILGFSWSIDPNAHLSSLSPWIKYANNPVVDIGAPGSWDSYLVRFPSVIFKDGTYRMWFDGGLNDLSSIRIGFASSTDGISWTQYADNPVLTVGLAGGWDSMLVTAPDVIFHNGIFEMWFRATNTLTDTLGSKIGYATSPDGISWTKYSSNPVVSEGPPGSWDSNGLFSASVLIDGDTYKMWYSGTDGTNFRIGYATSTNGINWTKYAGNPVLDIGSPQSWDSTHVYYPNVIYNGCFYEMWYTGKSLTNYAIGYATSADGIIWSKSTSNPVINIGTAGSWEDRLVIGSSVVPMGGTYQMWYTGANTAGNSRIGTATAYSNACNPNNHPIFLPIMSK